MIKQPILVLLPLMLASPQQVQSVQVKKDHPRPTSIEDISDAEWSAPDMVPAKYNGFNVSILVYKEDEFISNTIKTQGTWDGDQVNRLCKDFIKSGGKGNFLDVGGNIGAYTLTLADCLRKHGAGGNKVISVEGAPWNAKHVRAGIKYNNLNNVHLYEYAVGSPREVGMVEMKNVNGNAGMSHMGRISFMEQKVPLTTIDSIARSEGESLNNLFAMKIDIEGHELQAFEGATQFFKNGPCIIFMEMKVVGEEVLTDHLERLGYVVHQTGDADKNAWCSRKDFDQCLANLKTQ